MNRVDPSGLDSAPPGFDPIAFRKGGYKESKVKDPCARQTLEITFILGAVTLTIYEWTLLGIDIAAWQQMTNQPRSVPSGSPSAGTYPSRNWINTNLPKEGHHANQLNPNLQQYRGWTAQSINDTVNNPARTGSTTVAATGNPGTAYFNVDGSYVVRDNVTGDLVQMSNRNDPGWLLDNRIIMDP